MGHTLRRTIGLGSAIAAVALGTGLASPASAATVRCGAVITRNTTLTSDVGPCPGDGIVIGADRVTLDLGSHTVSGSAAMGNGSAGVRLGGRTGATVHNGTITGFDAGVVINGGSHNTVTGLNIHDNIGASDLSGDLGDGVVIGVFSASTANTVQDNAITHNGPYEGVGVFRAASTGNRILNNTIVDNNITTTFFGPAASVDDGINLGHSVEGSNSTLIANNAVNGNGAVAILACSYGGDPCVTEHNVIRANIIERNGFLPGGQSNPLITDGAIRIVSFAYSPAGDPINQVSADRIQNNKLLDNANGGIFVGSFKNQILANSATGSEDPFGLGEFDLADVTQNQIANIPPCDSNVWAGNVYGTASPDCVTTGGHQVGPGTASPRTAAPSTEAPPRQAPRPLR